MKSVNPTTFFSYIRRSPFGGRLTQQQLEGIQAINTSFFRDGADKDPRHLAYILATAFHETGGVMQPVREGFAKTDAAAVKIVAKRSYGGVDPVTKQVYYGRGFVQLTWAENYKKMGTILGIDLYTDPDKALDIATAADIIVEGMTLGKSGTGDFTGKAVEQYFNDTVDDPEGARAIVNGTDKAKLIAGYHKSFLDALVSGADGQQQPDASHHQAQADKPNLFKDPATLGTVAAVSGSGVFGLFSAIDSPWAFGAFAVVALGVVLFATGRLNIIRKAGA